MTMLLEDVVVPRQILLVEDEKIARENLARILQGRHYEVLLAESGSRAILQARRGDIGVVLMDIKLGDEAEMDGIDAAREIQLVHPLTSFIFVSAYAKESGYHERARRNRVRVGGWIEKPIRIQELVPLIEEELQKLKILAWLAEVQGFGGDPLEYLNQLKGSLPLETYRNLLEELQDSGEDDFTLDETDEIRPLQSDEEDLLMEITAEIDSVYSRIRALVATRRGDPEIKAALGPLRERLEDLQEQEAEAMERRFRSRLQFDPQQGRELLQRARILLGRK